MVSREAVCQLVTVACALGIASRVCGGDLEPKVQVEVVTPKTVYVLGEPVLLDLVVTNNSDRDVRMRDVLADPSVALPHIQVYLSSDGASRMWWPTDCVAEYIGEPKLIHPGTSRCYRLRVLYDYKTPTHLAFARPGRYSVKVNFPLALIAADGRVRTRELRLNAIEVDVRAPEGRDRAFWEEIQQDAFLRLLQFGLGPKEPALKVAKWLLSIPQTRYHDDLRWSLAKYYYKQRWYHHRLAEDEMELLREALSLKGHPEFPCATPQGLADERLEYNYASGYQTNMGMYELKQRLATLSKETGVLLRSELPLGESWDLRRTPEPVRLRTLMQWMVDPGRTAWFRDGDGYVLKLIERPEEQQSKTAPREEDAAAKPSQ